MPAASSAAHLLGQLGGRVATVAEAPSTRGPVAQRLHDILVDKLLQNYLVNPVRRQWEGVVRHSAMAAPHLKPGEETLREAGRNLFWHPIRTTKGGFRQMGGIEKALFGGLTGLQVVQAAKHPESSGENLGRTGASALSWLALRRTPLAASLLGALAAGELGGMIGRFRDLKNQPPPQAEEAWRL